MHTVILSGFVGQLASVNSVSAERDACNFTLATNESWPKKDGGYSEHTEWHDIAMFGKKGRFDKLVEKGLVSPGTEVEVTGQIRRRESEKDGVKYVNYSIVVDPSKLVIKRQAKKAVEQDIPQESQPQEPDPVVEQAIEEDDFLTDDIPF